MFDDKDVMTRTAASGERICCRERSTVHCEALYSRVYLHLKRQESSLIVAPQSASHPHSERFVGSKPFSFIAVNIDQITTPENVVPIGCWEGESCPSYIGLSLFLPRLLPTVRFEGRPFASQRNEIPKLGLRCSLRTGGILRQEY